MKQTLQMKVVQWNGRLHCVYLNDHRIAGGKPWGGGTVIKSFTVETKDVFAALGMPAPLPDPPPHVKRRE